MEKLYVNLVIFMAICVMVYILFRNFNYKEGMATDASGNTQAASVSANSGGNAAAYAATIKNATVKLQDTLLVSKYKTDYENVILNLDDLVTSLMLTAALSINTTGGQGQTNAIPALIQIGQLGKTQEALNNLMKFIDSQ